MLNQNKPVSALDAEQKHLIALKRADELKGRISDYLEAKKKIPAGLQMQEEFDKHKKNILELLNATEKDWKDYRWQLSNIFFNVIIIFTHAVALSCVSIISWLN